MPEGTVIFPKRGAGAAVQAAVVFGLGAIAWFIAAGLNLLWRPTN